MRSILLAALLAASPAALCAASPAAPVPQGRLPDVATPIAYRLDLTIQPEQDRFTGHAEIDVTLKAQTRSLYIHGRDLHVASATARAGMLKTRASYTQVDPLGVVRLDFAQPLPAGKVTLTFDYDAPFGSGAAGLFHVRSVTNGMPGRSSNRSMRAPPIPASTSPATRRPSPSR